MIMNNIILKGKQVVPTNFNVLVKPYKVNPYLTEESASGLSLSDLVENDESGKQELLQNTFKCGEVVAVGPKVTSIEVGDDVYFSANYMQPGVIYDIPYLACAEQTIFCAFKKK